MKTLHIIMALLVTALTVYQCFYLFASADRKVTIAVKILSHLCYLLIIVIGFGLLVPLIQLGIYPYWFIIKIVLFILTIVAIAKAQRSNNVSARKVTALFVVLAYLAIFALAGSKPNLGQFGHLASKHDVIATPMEHVEPVLTNSKDSVLDDMALANQE